MLGGADSAFSMHASLDPWQACKANVVYLGTTADEHACQRALTAVRVLADSTRGAVARRGGRDKPRVRCPGGGFSPIEAPGSCRSRRPAIGHNRSFPTRSQVLLTSTFERQVSGDESEAFVGSTRPGAVSTATATKRSVAFKTDPWLGDAGQPESLRGQLSRLSGQTLVDAHT